jgi:hypothetical protein
LKVARRRKFLAPLNLFVMNTCKVDCSTGTPADPFDGLIVAMQTAHPYSRPHRLKFKVFASRNRA